MNFIGFSFKPALGFLMAIISTISIMLLGIFHWFEMPTGFIITWISYQVFVVAFIIGNWISWMQYHDPAPKMQPWEGKKSTTNF